VGDQLTCVFVDNGLLRRDEGRQLIETFRNDLKVRLVHVDATDRFLSRLAGLTDPEEKRRVIGDEFAVLHEGRLVACGSLEELDASEDPLVEAFMRAQGGG